jgi:hypothetical protein
MRENKNSSETQFDQSFVRNKFVEKSERKKKREAIDFCQCLFLLYQKRNVSIDRQKI